MLETFTIVTDATKPYADPEDALCWVHRGRAVARQGGGAMTQHRALAPGAVGGDRLSRGRLCCGQRDRGARGAVVRAYLIDPKLETITEVNIENYYGDEGWLVEALIGCDNSVPAAFIDGSNLLDGLDLVLISEDVLELEEDGDYSFQIDADRGLMMATRLIAGSSDRRLAPPRTESWPGGNQPREFDPPRHVLTGGWPRKSPAEFWRPSGLEGGHERDPEMGPSIGPTVFRRHPESSKPSTPASCRRERAPGSCRSRACSSAWWRPALARASVCSQQAADYLNGVDLDERAHLMLSCGGRSRNAHLALATFS